MQVAMEFYTPGYQDIGKVSRVSMSAQIFSCNESHFKHYNLKMRGHLSMLGSNLRNLKIRGQPSLLGSKLSPVSLVVRKPKLVCKSFGSQDQRIASLIRTSTPKYKLVFTFFSYATQKFFSSFAFLPPLLFAMFAFIFAMLVSRPYQIGILVRVLNMNTAVASDVSLVIPTFISCVIFCVVMDLKNLKPGNIMLTAGIASFIFSLVGRKILESIFRWVFFYEKPTVGDFIYLKTKDIEVAGKVESLGLMSPLLIRGLSSEVHSIPIDTFADAAHVRLTVGPYKIIYFKFAVYQNMAHKIDDIIANIDEIVSKFSSHSNELQNFACVEGMDHNFKDVMILVSCLVEVDDVKEYFRIKGAIILEVFKLVAEVNNDISR